VRHVADQGKHGGGTERGKNQRTTINQGEVQRRRDARQRKEIAMVVGMKIKELRPTGAAVEIEWPRILKKLKI